MKNLFLLTLRLKSGILVILLMYTLNPNLSVAQITLTKTDEFCGNHEGTASCSVNHGTPPYTIQWSNGQYGPAIYHLRKGYYSVLVTDANGCQGTASVFVNDIGYINLTIDGGGIYKYCKQEGPYLVTVCVEATGGSGAYGYSPSPCQSTDRSRCFTFTVWDKNGGISCKKSITACVVLIPIFCPWDPNEIIGPKGYGPPQFISSKDPLFYSVSFENDPDFATAPAQKVVINHAFDQHINMYSLRLGEFGFRNMSFNVPDNSSTYHARLDVRDSLGLYVDVTAGIDVGNHQAFWIFQSIDPLTGLPPEDPMKGFLSVNDTSTHVGEGYVSFRVTPKATTLTGDTVKASAAIVFDVNEPISTNTWFNVADALPPVSHINAIPDSANADTVAISVTATDDTGGSGIDKVQIWACRENEDYEMVAEIQPDSVFTFSGQACSRYRFFSRAIDHTGNTEEMKTIHDAITILKPAPLIQLQPQDTMILGGGQASFQVMASGGDSFLWKFSRDGGITYSPLEDTLPYSGVNTSCLTIASVPDSLNGNKYLCQVSNGICFTESRAANLLILSSLSGVLRYDNDLLSPVSNAKVFLKTFSGNTVDSAMTNLSGTYLFNLVAPGNYLCGFQVSKSWGGVNATDAMLTLRHFTYQDTLHALRLRAADVNASNSINAIDALLIAKRYVGLTENFTSGDWVLDNDTITLTLDPQVKNVSTLCFGDVNASYIPGLKIMPAVIIEESDILRMNPGEKVVIPFYANRFLNSGAISLNIRYPSDLIEIDNVTLSSGKASRKLIYTLRNGMLKIAWYDTEPYTVDMGVPFMKISARLKERPLNQELQFFTEDNSEIADIKGKVEMGVVLYMPKLLSGDTPPNTFIVNQNKPNPCKQQTEISYFLPEEGFITLNVYNSLGQVITCIPQEFKSAGWHSYHFDASRLASGTYPFRIEFEGKSTKSTQFRIMSKIK